jgi:hypothetical protein
VLASSQVCDGVVDCPSQQEGQGQDEQGCVMLSRDWLGDEQETSTAVTEPAEARVTRPAARWAVRPQVRQNSNTGKLRQEDDMMERINDLTALNYTSQKASQGTNTEDEIDFQHFQNKDFLIRPLPNIPEKPKSRAQFERHLLRHGIFEKSKSTDRSDKFRPTERLRAPIFVRRNLGELPTRPLAFGRNKASRKKTKETKKGQT